MPEQFTLIISASWNHSSCEYEKGITICNSSSRSHCISINGRKAGHTRVVNKGLPVPSAQGPERARTFAFYITINYNQILP